jgi:hypothetical protein
MKHSRWTHSLIFLAAMLCPTLLSACNYVAGAAYIIGGQDEKPAEFELADRPTLVFVDDRVPVIKRKALQAAIGEKVSTDLMTEKKLSRTISPADAIALARQRDKHGNLMTIETVGESVGAEQVIYVQILAFNLSPDNITPKPMAAAAVRVIDVVSKQRLFPGVESNQPDRVVQVSSDASTSQYGSEADRRKLEDALAQKLGWEIGRLFYEHIPNEVGSRIHSPH